MNKLVSVVIPVYNSVRKIKKCIRSIMNQTYKEIEIIIVNEGSTDNSRKICEELKKEDQRVNLLNIINSGVSKARNIGIENAKGKYITFIDSDDYINDNMIQDLYEAIKNELSVDFVQCATIDVDETDKEISRTLIKENIYFNKEEYLKEVLREKVINGVCWGKLFRKELLEDVRFNEQIKINEDLDFLFHVLVKCNKILLINKCNYYWLKNSNSVTKKKYGRQWIDNIINTTHILANIKREFPTLEKYCKIKLFNVNIICYKKMLKDKICDEKTKSFIKNNLKKDKLHFLFDKDIKVKDKIIMIHLFSS